MSQSDAVKQLMDKVKALTIEGREKSAEVARLQYLTGEITEIPLSMIMAHMEKMVLEFQDDKVLARLTEVAQVHRGNTKEAQEAAFEAVDKEVSNLYREKWVASGVDGEEGLKALQNVTALLSKAPRQDQLACEKLIAALEAEEGNATMIAVVGKEKFEDIVKTQAEVGGKWDACKTLEERQELFKEIQSKALVVDKAIQEFMNEKPDEVQQFVESLPADDRIALLRMRIIQDIIRGESHGHSHNGQPCQGHGHQAHPPPQEQPHGHSHNGEPCGGHGHSH